MPEMYDDGIQDIFWMWIRRIAVTAAALVAAYGYVLYQRSLAPPVKMPRQNVAILRDHGARSTSRHHAAEALEKADPSVVPDLIDELQHGDSDGRFLAALALGLMRQKASAATEAMVAAAHDESQLVRREAARSLAKISDDPQLIAMSLDPVLRDPDAEVRSEAFESMGAQGEPGVETLLRLVDDPEADLRRRAIAELGRGGMRAENIVAALRRALDDPEPHVRAAAVRALYEQTAIGLDELVAMLAEPPLGFAAARVMRDVGADAEPAVPALRELLKSDDAETVIQVANVLGAIGPTARVATNDLAPLAVDGRAGVAPSVLGALRKIGWESECQPPLLWERLDAARDGVYSLFLDPQQFRPRGLVMAPMEDDRDRGYFATDADLVHLSTLHNLRVLDLSKTLVGDGGLVHLQTLDQLVFLNLSNTRVTSQGLTQLASLRELRSLDVSKCAIDNRAVDNLQKSLPNLQVIWQPLP